jgi:hypothetical protein
VKCIYEKAVEAVPIYLFPSFVKEEAGDLCSIREKRHCYCGRITCSCIMYEVSINYDQLINMT